MKQDKNGEEGINYGWSGFMPAAKMSFSNPSSPLPPSVDPGKIAQAIKNNETGGIRNPYSFRQPSNSGIRGDMANGAYQVTDAELATYAPKYLGKTVTSQQFMADPQMQDNYMNVKATALAGRGLTPDQIMAVHRGGGSDLTPPALQGLVQKYQPYVSKGMQFYNQGSSPISTGRSINDLSVK